MQMHQTVLALGFYGHSQIARRSYKKAKNDRNPLQGACQATDSNGIRHQEVCSSCSIELHCNTAQFSRKLYPWLQAVLVVYCIIDTEHRFGHAIAPRPSPYAARPSRRSRMRARIRTRPRNVSRSSEDRAAGREQTNKMRQKGGPYLVWCQHCKMHGGLVGARKLSQNSCPTR